MTMQQVMDRICKSVRQFTIADLQLVVILVIRIIVLLMQE